MCYRICYVGGTAFEYIVVVVNVVASTSTHWADLGFARMSEVDVDDGERVRLGFVWFDGRLTVVDELFRFRLTGVAAAVFLISFGPLLEVNDAPLAPRPTVCPCPPRRAPRRVAPARPRAYPQDRPCAGRPEPTARRPLW